MWVYIQSEPQLWTVGFYDPKGKWHPDSDHESKQEAAQRVHYLNGKVSLEWLNEALNEGDGVYRP